MERTDPGLYGINVLVVEDHADTADMLAEALRFCDAYAVTANSARSALHTFNTMAACDVVVTDLSMPDDDGVWLVQQIRASNRPQIRVIAVTGHAVDKERRMVDGVRFDAVVMKPVDPFDVCRMVLEVLGPERAGRCTGSPSMSHPAPW
jgi:CheY-like chemotaxis protein